MSRSTHRYTAFHLRGSRFLSTKSVIWVAAFAILGASFIYFSQAATPPANIEAEQGVMTGNAQKIVGDQSTSGSTAVKFSAAPQLASGPVGLHAYTGGNNIALRWIPPSLSSASVTFYHVFRDGSEIGAVDVSKAVYHYFETPGTAYYDYNISAGQQHTYQVQAEMSDGTYTAKSPNTVVTVPTTTAAVPSLTVNFNGLTDPRLQTIANEATTALRIWYPKAVNTLAGTSYSPTKAMTLMFQDHTKFSGSYCDGMAGWVVGGAGALGTTMNLCDSLVDQIWYASYVAVHESTHIIQGYVWDNQSKMLTEGLADWMADQSVGVVRSVPIVPETYDDGYDSAAAFFSWILKNYNVPTLLKDMNVAGHQNTTDPLTIVKKLTGKSVGQLWTQMSGVYESSLGPLSGAAGTCAKPASGSAGAILQTLSCGAQPRYQNVVYAADPAKPSVGLIKYGFSGFCLGTSKNATTAASYIVLTTCDLNVATQFWQHQADGSLKNVGANLCMQPSGGKTVDGTNMLIADCSNASTTPTRRWALPGA